MRGIVKFYKEEEGWGFIQPDELGESDVFIHASSLSNGYVPQKDDVVDYEVKEGKNGKTMGCQVVLVSS